MALYCHSGGHLSQQALTVAEKNDLTDVFQAGECT